ncbi:glycine betaine ABC transporter substrate-binding protein [Paenibacillus sp. JDR-2]|uniref:glycine betaine ABC transporter substrate-binding protein n=1 Tax=Paenibacillus sp. (strain JDR-2) TaxID=324057 RepID=UPI000166A6A4|nr:glycine betaine ABC transporter substrate-binding protein [Paenibacillus sp. JDR-2]ACT00301.1 Substrate-binding region of ABC-type glycine betaine transport system [Paenibacillus sp. JDR-2]
MRHIRVRFGLLVVVIIAFCSLLSGCGKGNTIIIGTQTFSEPKIIANMYKLLIEDRTDMKVKVMPDLATSTVVLDALTKDDIQMASLYSGIILDNYFPIERTNDRASILKQAQEGFDKHYGLKWFDSYGFENTYAFTVRKDLAEQEQLHKISDVKNKATSMRLGVDTSWLERAGDGYADFQKVYGITFGKVYPMEVALVYSAIATNKMDIVVAYSTDARLKEYELVTLEDDKHFFPPYDASPVIRKEVLEAHPELQEIIHLLIGKLDAKTIIDLNYEVDVNKRNEKKVAEEYLKQIGLLK